MTAKKKITDKNGVQVFPITHTKAVFDDNGNSVEQRLQEQMGVINQKQLEVGAVPSDVAPTEGSTNWVTSGGIANALSGVLKGVGYFECNTAANTANKTIAATGYSLRAGGCIKIKMINANTADNATLTVGSTAAKPLFYGNERASAGNTWEAGEVVEVYYDPSYNSNTGAFYANNVAGGSGDGAFDISKYKAVNGTPATYRTLTEALGTNGANVPSNKRKGGMTIKFVQSSDNKYVQCRYMGTSTANADFTNVANWQGVDDEPTAGSKNLVESGGVEAVKVSKNHGRNYLDPSTIKINRYIYSNTGEERTAPASQNFAATDFIAVKSGDVLICCKYAYAVNTVCHAVYDSNKSYLRSFYEKYYTYQEGDAYVRFTIKNYNLSRLQVINPVQEQEDFVVNKTYPYSPIGGFPVDFHTIGLDNLTTEIYKQVYSLDTIFNISENINLLDKKHVSSGVYINKNTGDTPSASTCFATSFIPIDSEGLSINIQATGGLYGWACYDSMLSFTHGGDGRTASFQDGDVYARFTGLLASIDSTMIVKGGVDNIPETYVPGYVNVLTFRPQIIKTEDIKDKAVLLSKTDFSTIIIGKNKLNPTKIVSGWIDKTNGIKKTGTDYCATPFIKVSENGLHFNKPYNSGNVSSAVYDNDENYLRALGSANYIYQEGDGYVRWTMTKASYDAGNLQVEEGSISTAYEPYKETEVIDPAVIPPFEITDEYFMSKANNNGLFSGAIDIFLPNKIYAVVGDTLQMFFQGMAKCVNVENYNTLVACSKGSQFHRYFQYTPSVSDVGTVNFNFYIKDNNRNIIGYGSSSLVTVNAPSSPSSNVNVLCVGDSITDGGEWPKELMRRLTANDGSPVGNGLTNITFVGSMLKSGVHFEGHSGYSWRDYATRGRAAFRFTIPEGTDVREGAVYSNNGFNYTVIELGIDNTIRCSTSSFSNVPLSSGTLTKVSGSGDAAIQYTNAVDDSQNPFWDADNSKLSFTKYANLYCNGAIDVIYVLLGANGLFADPMNNVKTFIDAFHTDFPNGKVKLMGMYVPSMKLMMPGYGATGNSYADTYNVVCKLKDQARDYQAFANDSDYSSFVEFVDVACQLDSDYNFPLTQKAVNIRNSVYQEPYANNTIHSSVSGGFMQIADAAYRNFVANFCQ